MQGLTSMVGEFFTSDSPQRYEKAYKNAGCAKCQCLENVCATTDSAIKEDRNSPCYFLHHLLARESHTIKRETAPQTPPETEIENNTTAFYPGELCRLFMHSLLSGSYEDFLLLDLFSLTNSCNGMFFTNSDHTRFHP